MQIRASSFLVSYVMLIGSQFLAGCAAPPMQMQPAARYSERVGTIPKLNEVTSAPVGGVMFSQFKYKTLVGPSYAITASNGLNMGFMLGRILISEGDQLLESRLEGDTVYCSQKLSYIDPLVGPYRAACFFDGNGDGYFKKVKAAPGSIYFEKEIVPPLAYKKTALADAPVIAQSDDSFKFELLYQGGTRNTLKLAYREYIKDFARPAYFQDVTYDLESKPTTITFRTVRIEVLAADNNQISYRVLSTF